jgi:hypothetical protein
VQCDDLVEIQSQAFETKEFVRWTGVLEEGEQIVDTIGW